MREKNSLGRFPRDGACQALCKLLKSILTVPERDAKIRRMAASHVNMFERPLQSASTSARSSERIRRCPGGQLLSAYRTAYKMERAPRTMMLSRGRNHRTTRSLAFRVIQKLKRNLMDSPHDSPFGQETLVRTRNVQIDIWCDGAERTRPGTDGPGTSHEPCLLRDTAHLRSQLTTTFTNGEREALFRCIRTDADIKPAQTPINTEKTQTFPQHPPCSKRTVDHGSPETR